ncbi:MAG: LemA family protein [Deltaproteobacteria bacterium]|nr:MAG: LemA family protein [Deltaproteobacteria bacterium]
MKKVLIVIIVFIVLAGLWGVSTRNGFVTMEENVKQSWSQVENVYQRRLDLIPNLVATVQGYASHERETLEAVTQARASVGQISAQGLQNITNDPKAFERFQQAQGSLSSALSRLMVVAEKYPDLKANENFLDLQKQLEGTENRIAVERRRFNEAAQSYNTAIRMFPGSLIAGFSGFQQKNYFTAAPEAAQAPKVQFNTTPPATH